MKKTSLLILITIFGMVPVCMGKVSTRVCLADGNTPLELADPCVPYVYRDIMVGTKLTIIVSSDVNKPWRNGPGTDGGSLAIEEAYWNYGVLSARDYNDITYDYEGSHFPAAGNEALVSKWGESGILGFDMYTGSTGIEAGDWFIIDYNATGVGICKVGFYDHTKSWFVPIYYLTFSHVRTRDFNNDTMVNFADFAVLASYWQQTNCGSTNNCEGADLDINGKVDFNDLMLFTDYWLDRTE
jgi:hypothetical protein